MEQESFHKVRRLFEAACDLPPGRWEQTLAGMTGDARAITEALALLQSQGAADDKVRRVVEKLLCQAGGEEPAEGELLGPWQLRKRLAAGGMGVVFLAERADGLYAREVAIKLLRAQASDRVASQLSAECRILASLAHPGISRLYDVGLTPANQPYLVMEYVQGQRLDDWNVRSGASLEQRLALFDAICRAVAHAHARLILHCDLKPGNIVVGEDGKPVLLDFGVARLAGAGGQTGTYCTPAYAAPELLAPCASADTRTDVHGLGMLLCELLAMASAAREPGQTAVRLPSDLADASVPWHARLSGDADAIVARACAEDPEQRYPSVEALAADVRAMATRHPVAARGGGRGYHARRWLQRHWRGMSMALFVLVLVVVFIHQLQQARDRAEHEARVADQVATYMVRIFEAADPRARGVRGGERVTVNEVLDAAAARLRTDLDQADEVRARLMAVIGNAYLNIGEKRRAFPMLEEAAEALASHGGERNMDEALRLLNMASGGHAQERRSVRAEAMARRALELMGSKGEGSFRQAQSYNSLGLALLAQQRYDEAEAAFNRALANHQKAGREHFVGVTRDNLGMMHRRRGQVRQALEQFAHSTPMFQRTMGEMSFDYWASNTEYGMALLEAGELDRAIALFEKNLARAPTIFGQHSVYVGSEQYRLALALLRKGELARAGELLARAMALTAEVMGQDGYTYSLQQEALVQLARQRGQRERAEALARQVLAVRDRTIGEDNPDSHDAALLLAQVLIDQGDADGAAPLLQRVRTQWLARIPARSSNAVRIGHVLAQWLMLQGRDAEARQVLLAQADHASALNAPLAREQSRLQALLDNRHPSGTVGGR